MPCTMGKTDGSCYFQVVAGAQEMRPSLVNNAGGGVLWTTSQQLDIRKVHH